MAEIYKLDSDDSVECPKWVKGKVARTEFTRIVDEMKKRNMVNQLDINTIGQYCIAYINYLEVTKQLENVPMFLEQETKMGKRLIEHPLIATQLKYSAEMDKLGSKLGLNVLSRQKIKNTDKKKDNKFNKFSAAK